MKFLLTTYEVYDQGGTAQRAWRMARDLAQRHQVTLLCEPPHSQQHWSTTQLDGITITTHPSFGSRRWRHSGLSPTAVFLKSWYVWKHRRNFTHLYGFGHRPSVFLPACVARISGYCVIADWCDLWGWSGIGSTRLGIDGFLIRLFDTFTERLYYQFVPHQVTAISTNLTQRAKKWRSSWSVTHVSLPIPRQRSLRTTRKERLKNIELGYSTASDHDSHFVLETLLNLKRYFDLTKQPWVLHFVGPMPSWHTQIRHLHLEKQIHFYGFVSHKESIKILKKCNAFLLPFPPTSLNIARVPNKILDYYIFQKPIFTQNTGDMALIAKRIPWITLAPEPTARGYAESIVNFFTAYDKKEESFSLTLLQKKLALMDRKAKESSL